MLDNPDLIAHVWPNPKFDCLSNDYGVFASRLRAVCDARGFESTVLGVTAGQPICLLTRMASRPSASRLLIASGFHGEEPAGPWGLLQALETLNDGILGDIQLSILPLVNITGFSRGTRLNHRNENPNRGYLAIDDSTRASEEGTFLLEHEARLVSLGRDGVLSCHEDQALAHAYVYANERAESPGDLAIALRECNAGHFPLHPDGFVDGCPIKDGIVFNQLDSSFESWLLKRGAARTYCTETPGQFGFEQRVSANADMITTFMEFFR